MNGTKLVPKAQVDFSTYPVRADYRLSFLRVFFLCFLFLGMLAWGAHDQYPSPKAFFLLACCFVLVWLLCVATATKLRSLRDPDLLRNALAIGPAGLARRKGALKKKQIELIPWSELKDVRAYDNYVRGAKFPYLELIWKDASRNISGTAVQKNANLISTKPLSIERAVLLDAMQSYLHPEEREMLAEERRFIVDPASLNLSEFDVLEYERGRADRFYRRILIVFLFSFFMGIYLIIREPHFFPSWLMLLPLPLTIGLRWVSKQKSKHAAPLLGVSPKGLLLRAINKERLYYLPWSRVSRPTLYPVSTTNRSTITLLVNFKPFDPAGTDATRKEDTLIAECSSGIQASRVVEKWRAAIGQYAPVEIGTAAELYRLIG